MLKKVGPIEINCDAPLYVIVQACQRLDFQSPEDVRWCRMSHYLNPQTSWRALLEIRNWKSMWEDQSQARRQCFCGAKLPVLMMHIFTMSSGAELSFFLGQCKHCRTIFWEQVQ